jgi:lysophospholipase L1-like esterase
MSKFPSIKVITYTLVAIVIYLSLDFYLKGEKTFFQLNYNWDAIELINDYQITKIDTISYNYLSLASKGVPDSDFNSNYTCSLDGTHYFRYASLDKSKSHLTFRGVYWINSTPGQEENINSISTVQLPLIQKGDHTVCMIGDSQLTWQYGRYTRKDVIAKRKNIKFIGNELDVIGYPYQATLLNNSQKIVEQLSAIPTAKTYVLFIGAHEVGVNHVEKNLDTIISHLLDKQASLVLVIPPTYKNKDYLPNQLMIKKTYLEFKEHAQVKIIDLSKHITDKEECFLPDGIHLNSLGHHVLTKSLIKTLKDLE